MDSQPVNSAPAPAPLPERRGAWQGKPCPYCGTPNVAWASACVQCHATLPDALEAAQAQNAHIEYLLNQLPGWQRRGMLSNSAYARLRSDYLLLHQQLADYAFRLQHERSSTTSGATSVSASPAGTGETAGTNAAPASSPNAQAAPSFWPMDLPGIFPGQPAPAAPAPAAASALPSAAAPPYVPPFVPPPPAPPSPPAGDGTRRFFQKHALQIIFALATVLVLAALRSMLGWEWIGDVAMRLLPVVPLALTAMFWTFGQKTRDENPWAAFVYHGLAAALSGFDVIALNKYCLPVPLSAKPILLLAALAAACVSGALLRKWREIAYLHLFQPAVVTVLFATLQLLRPDTPSGDFRITPVWLFGIAFLLYALFCLVMARRSEPDAPQETADTYTTRNSNAAAPNAPPVAFTTSAALPFAAFGQSWKLAWTFWAHFSVIGVAFLAAVNLALEHPNPDDFALLSLLSGLIYVSGAQMLQDARMVRAGGAFLLAGGLLWLGGHERARAWEGTCALLLTMSALALVLARYNRQISDNRGVGGQLAKAYVTLGEWGGALAVGLAWSYVFYILFYAFADTFSAGDSKIAAVRGLTGTFLTGFCGAYYALFARWESRPNFLYAAFATWGVTLWSLLLALIAPHGLYPLVLVAYGAALVLSASRRVQKTEADALPAAQAPSQIQSNSGLALVTVGAVLAAALPFHDSLTSAWLWSGVTLSLALLLCLHEMRREENACYAYAALTCGAYVSALLTWRILVLQPFRLADSLAPFALFASGSALLLAKRRVSAPVPSSDAPPNITYLPNMVEGVWEACLLRTALVAALACLTDGLWAFGLGPNAAHYAFSLLPCLLAGGMLCAARWVGNRDANDALRRVALACVGVTAGVEIGLWCGLTQGAGGWHNDALRAWGIGLVALAWLCKAGASLSPLWREQDWWTGEITLAALTTAFVGILPLTLSAAPKGSSVALFQVAFAAAFALFAIETVRTQEKAITLLSLLVVAFAGVANRTLAPDAVTLTFAAYGILYAGLLLRCRTASLAAAASLALTAAYLHHLLTLTAWYVTPPVLSWPHCAFYASQAALLWLAIGWRVRVRLNRADLANPLLALAGGLALASGTLALVTVQTPGEGKWSVLTLGWAGAAWFALWAMEQGEICLHVAAWNLLLAWGITLYDRLGADAAFLDLYLLPVGLYLVSIGYLHSRRQRAAQAQQLWTAGLLLTITPAFLAFWQGAGDIHTLLFVGECLLSTLWGIAQRIRAFVLVGMGFIALYAGAVTVGHLPDVWGTLVTLVIGVMLFVIGFVMLTRRAIMQRVTSRLEAHWAAWRAWR